MCSKLRTVQTTSCPRYTTTTHAKEFFSEDKWPISSLQTGLKELVCILLLFRSSVFTLFGRMDQLQTLSMFGRLHQRRTHLLNSLSLSSALFPTQHLQSASSPVWLTSKPRSGTGLVFKSCETVLCHVEDEDIVQAAE